MIENLSKLIPASMQDKSGKVFYSGRDAFSSQANLYVLGLNPGGSPVGNAQEETVASHTEFVFHSAGANWSCYRDESWNGMPPGKATMQPRLLYLFRQLGLDPGKIPASNTVFIRSARANTLQNTSDLQKSCWPFHQQVIEALGIRVVLCLGGGSGKFVQKRLGAHDLVDNFVEENNRHWKSSTYRSNSGLEVVVASHPSIADWSNPATDISPLLRRSLQRAST